MAYGRCRVVAQWGPHTKSIRDLSTFLSSTGPQVSIGVENVSIRACKHNFLPIFFFRSLKSGKKVLPDANTKIKTVQPNGTKLVQSGTKSYVSRPCTAKIVSPGTCFWPVTETETVSNWIYYGRWAHVRYRDSYHEHSIIVVDSRWRPVALCVVGAAPCQLQQAKAKAV